MASRGHQTADALQALQWPLAARCLSERFAAQLYLSIRSPRVEAPKAGSVESAQSELAHSLAMLNFTIHTYLYSHILGQMDLVTCLHPVCKFADKGKPAVHLR